jgi:3-hydroxyacyl-CoA dehydrogenase
MGAMGTGIAHALILTGIPVAVHDEDASAIERGLRRIEKSMRKRVEQGKLTADGAEETLCLLSQAADLSATGDADLVIEAVVEDAAVKQSVLGAIEQACGEQTIIATNTSTISLDVLAEGMRNRDRLIGMHFFNPAHRMPLVEVIRRDPTPEPILATAMQLAKKMGKTPVLVKNREGFLVNRIFIPCLKEGFFLLEEGVSPVSIDAAMVDFGFPMGPLALTDMAGVDVLVFIDAVLSRVFPDHGVLSPIAARLVERGRLGQKSGGGVYDYERGDYTPRHSAVAQEIIDEVRREAGGAPRHAEAGEITRRLVMRMVAEAFRVKQEGLVQRESDIDAATVLGVAFPDSRGGVLKYARDYGIDNVIGDLRDLAREHGERYSPCSLVQGMKG